MAHIDLETDARARAGNGSKKAASPPRRGGGRKQAPAARGALGRALARFRENVWAPVALRLLGIFGGMLALAAIGASSIARGSGVPLRVPPAATANGFLAGGLSPVATNAPPAAARASATPLNDGGASPADAGGDPGDAGAGPAEAGLTAEGKVILNRASADELRKLPGVGAKRAEAIVALRAKLGRFKRVTDLLRVKGIGPRGLKKREPHLVLDAPS
jgi:competence protein ComEA